MFFDENFSTVIDENLLRTACEFVFSQTVKIKIKKKKKISKIIPINLNHEKMEKETTLFFTTFRTACKISLF